VLGFIVENKNFPTDLSHDLSYVVLRQRRATVFVPLNIESAGNVPAKTLSKKTTKVDFKVVLSNRSMKTSTTIDGTSTVLHTYDV
jgi:hypothetical protein